MTSNKLLYIFLHIPKTGVSTTIEHLKNHMEPHKELILLGPKGEEEAKKLGIKPFIERTYKERHEAKVIIGHNAYYGIHDYVPEKKARYLVFFRRPEDRIISQYNYDAYFMYNENTPNFDQWLGKKKGVIQSYMANFLEYRLRKTILLDKIPLFRKTNFKKKMKIRHMLEKFWFVGVTEKLDVDLPHIFSTMSIPSLYQRKNVSGKDYTEIIVKSKESRKRLTEYCGLDTWLYKIALRLRNLRVRTLMCECETKDNLV